MKKIVWLFICFVLSLGLVACSSLRSVGQKHVAPGDLHVVLLNTVDSKAASTKKSKEQFHYGDMVYAYMTLGWDQNTGYTDLMVDGAPSPHQSDTTLRWLIDRLRS